MGLLGGIIANANTSNTDDPINDAIWIGRRDKTHK
jgi:hypothetical protein